MPKVIVRYNFAGALLFPSSPAQNVDLQGIVTPSGPVVGAFEFDASTLPTTPGKFDLTSAKFEGNFGGLKVHATGGHAVVQGANDSTLAFTFPLAASLFPVPIKTAQASFSFVSFLDFYFGRAFLPAREILDGDRTTGVTFIDAHGKHGNLSTDTNVHFTSFTVTVV